MRSPQNRSTLKIGTLFPQVGGGVGQLSNRTYVWMGRDGGVELRELNEDDQK